MKPGHEFNLNVLSNLDKLSEGCDTDADIAVRASRIFDNIQKNEPETIRRLEWSLDQALLRIVDLIKLSLVTKEIAAESDLTSIANAARLADLLTAVTKPDVVGSDPTPTPAPDDKAISKETIKERILSLLKSQGYTARSFADAIGVSPVYFLTVIGGGCNSLPVAEHIAAETGRPIDALFPDGRYRRLQNNCMRRARRQAQAEKIYSALAANGATVEDVAADLGITPASVEAFIRQNAKSRRIAGRISEITGIPAKALFHVEQATAATPEAEHTYQCSDSRCTQEAVVHQSAPPSGDTRSDLPQTSPSTQSPGHDTEGHAKRHSQPDAGASAKPGFLSVEEALALQAERRLLRAALKKEQSRQTSSRVRTPLFLKGWRWLCREATQIQSRFSHFAGRRR